MDNDTFYTKATSGKMQIFPFSGLDIGDKVIFYELDNILLIFSYDALEYDTDVMLNNRVIDTKYPDDRAFLRKFFGSMKYISEVEDGYLVKVHKDLIDKYNLREGATLIQDGHHLICESVSINKKTM